MIYLIKRQFNRVNYSRSTELQNKETKLKYNTRDSNDLPQAISINKQITYAEYAAKTLEISKDKEIYNAFLLPYNKESEKFDANDIFVNVGEATGEWWENTQKYEHIQCILIDVRYLMENYKIHSTENIVQLANAIEEAFEENKQFYES